MTNLLDSFYPVRVYPDRTTKGAYCYVAEHPDLPGCVGFGDTIEAAKADLAKAREAMLTAIRARGEEPTRPFTNAQCSVEMFASVIDQGTAMEGMELQAVA